MSERKQARAALGRGLRSLISTPPVAVGPTTENLVPFPQAGPLTMQGSMAVEHSVEHSGPQYLPIDKLVNNSSQPRQDFSDREIEELSESIKTLGVLQPILVRPTENNDGTFEIVAGERRWRAAQRAGLSSVPVLVRTLNDRETLEIALVENIQRQNLNAVEEALAYQRLSEEFKLGQQEIAERVGKDRASISNFLRILKLPAPVLQMLREGQLSMGHAKAILTVREPSMQLNLAKKILAEHLSVRQLEAIVSRQVVLPPVNGGAGQITAKSADRDASGGFGELVERLRRKLGTKVLIKHHTSGRGGIVVQYFSEQELGRLVDAICDGERLT